MQLDQSAIYKKKNKSIAKKNSDQKSQKQMYGQESYNVY